MKRYKSDPCRSCYGLDEAPDGDWVRYKDAAGLQGQLTAAENELRRLGHGAEVIDVITENGVRFTSYVGDISWDTAGNRARVRAAHAAAEAAAKAYHAELEELWARVTEACAALGSAGSSYGPMWRIASALEALRGRR